MDQGQGFVDPVRIVMRTSKGGVLGELLMVWPWHREMHRTRQEATRRGCFASVAMWAMFGPQRFGRRGGGVVLFAPS